MVEEEQLPLQRERKTVQRMGMYSEADMIKARDEARALAARLEAEVAARAEAAGEKPNGGKLKGKGGGGGGGKGQLSMGKEEQ